MGSEMCIRDSNDSTGSDLVQTVTPHRRQPVVLIPADNGRPGQDRGSRLIQRLSTLGDSFGHRLVRAIEAKVTAHVGIFIDQQDSRTVIRRRHSGAQPRRPTANDDNIGVEILFVVTAFRGLRIDDTEACRVA